MALAPSTDSAPQDLLQLQAQVARLERIIQLKDEQIRLLNLRLFGPKAETLCAAQTQLLFEEPSVTEAEVAREAALPPEQKDPRVARPQPPRPNHPGRERLPEHLERREEILPCCPADCRCTRCGAERPVIGYETREELACEPAQFYVRVIKREKRGSHCEDEQGVATAAAPTQIVPKGKLSDDFIIEALVEKYQLHVPVYRQCAALAGEYGIELSRKTVAEGILAAGQLLGAVVRAQRVELLAGGYIQADETTMPCRTQEEKGRNHRAYLWEYSVPGGIVVYQFEMGRGREGPLKFLQGFRGKLQCDGYEAYDKLGEGIVYVGCLAHARRGFVEAARVAPLNPIPPEILETFFGRLYAVEKEARQAHLGCEARLALRQAKSAPTMAALRTRLQEVRQQISPGGKLAQACDYTLRQWSRLQEFLSDGRLEIDNNWCEGAMRPLALGRKNWLHIGSPEAGPKVAAIASIVETCRRLDINLRQYLRAVLPKLGTWPIHRVAELTPAAWKAAQANKS